MAVNTKIAHLTVVLAGLLFGAGCANPSVLVLTNFEKEYHAVDPDSVRITTESPTTPPYLEIGYIYMQDNALDDVMRISRKRAAEAGGEAIMNARVGINVTQVGNILTFPVYDHSFFVRGIVVRRKGVQ